MSYQNKIGDLYLKMATEKREQKKNEHIKILYSVAMLCLMMSCILVQLTSLVYTRTVCFLHGAS